VARTTTTTKAESAIPEHDDFIELLTLFGETIAGLKQSVPPPPAVLSILERSELSARHVAPLMTIALSGPLSVSDLARRLGHTLPTTSTLVGQLSRAGLVERAEDEHDRRRTIVRVHDDYAEQIASWSESAFGPLQATLHRLSPQARANFMAGWRILHEEATRRAGGAGE
jgi:DNA-binding MarR family transcriptional regulator